MKHEICKLSELTDLTPSHALVEGVDLVIIKDKKDVYALYGRCLHRGALLSDGHIQGEDIICGVHGWDFRYKTGISAYDNSEILPKFKAWTENGIVYVDREEIRRWAEQNPQPYNRDQYLGQYADHTGTKDEPKTKEIHQLARNGLSKTGHHGPMAAMGVPAPDLPKWDDIQILTAQLATKPLADDTHVGTDLIIGPNAKKPLRLEIPIFVSDMSFGALSEEAKVAMAVGAENAGTGICSGEGGMLPEEQAANSRYLYELASAKFGYKDELMTKVQAFHFKGGQGAKTGTGGHLPGTKVKDKIAKVRHLKEGEDAISPSAFAEFSQPADFANFADRVREISGGIPIGFKISANHIEDDIEFCLKAGADYIILDGRGGGTGAAPVLFRNHISVPTLPALARARHHLDKKAKKPVTLIVTGGLRTPSDFIKALCLGADGIAVSNAAMQAIGCIAMRACHTNNCPVGIATQQGHLRTRVNVEKSAAQLTRFFDASIELMQVMARACGHAHLNQFNTNDITTFNRDVAQLTGIRYAGVPFL